MNVNEWKVRINDIPVAQILRFEKSIEQNKTVNKTLDGSIYIQTVGAGINYADVTVLCTRYERDIFNSAEADGTLLYLTYRDNIYSGYIESPPTWNTVYPGEWYSADIKLLIENIQPV